MSKGFGRVEASIIEQVMRLGVVAVPLLRFSHHGLMPSEKRPVLHGLWGGGQAGVSRQSMNRALLKLEAAKIVWRSVRSDGGISVLMTEPVLRKSFRVAGEAFMAHVAGNLRAASLDGIELTSRENDIELRAAGAFAEQKIVEIYGFNEPVNQINISKRDQKAMKKLIDDAIHTIARVAENLVISKKLSAARIKQLIENPLDGE